MVPVRDVGCSICVFRSRKPSSSLSPSLGSSMPVITCCETIHCFTASSSAVRKWLNMPLIIWTCDLSNFGSRTKWPMDICLMPPLYFHPGKTGCNLMSMGPFVLHSYNVTSCNKWNIRGSQGMPYMQCGILYCDMVTTVLQVVTLILIF